MGVTSENSLTANKAVRYDDEKPRYSLIPPRPMEDLAKLATAGARKYEDHNWTKGMEWTRALNSLRRHIAEFEKGEDYDPETGLLHITHAMWNCMILNEYYYTHTELDDRHSW